MGSFSLPKYQPNVASGAGFEGAAFISITCLIFPANQDHVIVG
jgi:hypothetical protein